MWGNVWLLFQKEIVGAVRDRRTMILTVLFPLVFYPLVLSMTGLFSAAERTRIEELVPTVLVVDQAKDPAFTARLQATMTLDVLFVATLEQGKADLEAERGQILMDVTRTGSGASAGLNVTLHYDKTNRVSAVAAARVREFLEGYLKAVLEDKLADLGLKLDKLSPPLSVNVVDTASSSVVGRMILSRLVPYFMVLAILTGAMGLGAEITAGEKERGTIATLLVSQLSRTEIVLGKFLAILTVSLVTSLLSAVGLFIGLQTSGGGLAPMGAEATFSLGPATLGWMVVVLLPLAVIIAALVLIVGSYARSQKEASTYLLPVYMGIILVGMASMTGGMQFSGTRFLIPIANVLYALQEVIVGETVLSHLVYTLVGNAVCGVLLIVAAIGVFRREAVLFRS